MAIENRDRHSFFVTGLPRTRGAWLAHYLSTMCHCEHEAGLRIIEGTEVSDLWPGILQPVGTVDLSFPLWAKQAADQYGSDSPVVIINRDPLEVIESLKREFPVGLGSSFPYQYGEIVSQALLDLESVRVLFDNVLEVDYEDIDDRIEDIVNHLRMGYRFNRGQYEYMKRFNITVHPSNYVDLLDKRNISGPEVSPFAKERT